MAVELCSENSSSVVVMSPRISFSHDFSQMETVPVEQCIRSNSSSGVDFDFCVFRESFDQEYSSSADDLFSDGKILPIGIKKRLPPQENKPAPEPHHEKSLTIKNNGENSSSSSSSREAKMVVFSEELDDYHHHNHQKQNSSKSFWGFKRSYSLNCGSSYARSLCRLPLLSRSNSTGSATSAYKRSSMSSKDSLSNKQQYSQKFSAMKQSQSSSSSTGHHHQKPPLKKNYGSSSVHSNAIKINPVLNVPSAGLFGLGSFFSSTKEKNKKKERRNRNGYNYGGQGGERSGLVKVVAKKVFVHIVVVGEQEKNEEKEKVKKEKRKKKRSNNRRTRIN